MNVNNITDQPIKIGITHGDFNGINYEIILKAMKDKRLLEFFTPVIYGSSKIASYYRKAFDMHEVNFNLIKKADFAGSKKANIINIYGDEVKVEIGKITKNAGELGYLALEKAVDDLKWGKIDAIVTAPISKSNIQSDQFRFVGHSEYFASKFNAEDHLMLMVSNDLRIGMITGHVPLSKVSESLSLSIILSKIKIMDKSLRMDFNIRKPKLAVLGLNPHAGDNGLIGTEEQEFIKPAIEKAKEEGILVFGPFPADGFFGSSNFRNFDGILAMYHDQGMLPFKAMGFEQGVNFTAGLTIVRTSPAHGTAFDIAGKNIASPNSLMQALYLALDIYRNRKQYEELSSNPLDSPVSHVKSNNSGENNDSGFMEG